MNVLSKTQSDTFPVFIFYFTTVSLFIEPSSSGNASLTYEFPFTERTRILLRLEDLFNRFEFFLCHNHPLHHHTALMTLFEIMEVGGRIDMRSDLLVEMEKQKQLIASGRGQAGLNAALLDKQSQELERGITQLNAANGRLAQHLRENDWLMSIRSRSGIPGGVCGFDIPSYHAWLQQPSEARRDDFIRWVAPTNAMLFAVRLVLGILRSSGEPIEGTAQNGSYSRPMNGKVSQLLCVRIPNSIGAIPEFSANKHMLWIRFYHPTSGSEPKNQAFEEDIDFEFVLCNT